MSAQKRAAEETVHLYPTGDAYIQGEPAIEREVSAKEAKVLLAYDPPAYTTTPPAKPKGKGKPEPEAEPAEAEAGPEAEAEPDAEAEEPPAEEPQE